MADIITQESDPETWERLYAIWLQEKKPGWVVTGKLTYTVIQKVGGNIAFKPQNAESLYETTSF